jgi:hypothetical protein
MTVVVTAASKNDSVAFAPHQCSAPTPEAERSQRWERCEFRFNPAGVSDLKPATCGISELVPTVLDRRVLPMDLERLSVAMPSSPEAIRRMTFTGETPEALEFVARRFPLWTCRRCASEFIGRDIAQARLRNWFIALASKCRRCGGQLTPVRARAGVLHRSTGGLQHPRSHLNSCDADGDRAS